MRMLLVLHQKESGKGRIRIFTEHIYWGRICSTSEAYLGGRNQEFPRKGPGQAFAFFFQRAPEEFSCSSLISNNQSMGRSTTEVHPNFSEAPRLRISIPHPKIDFSEIQVASRRVTPWPESTKRFLSKSRLAFRRFGVKEPRLSETKSGNVLPLSYNGSNTFEYQ